MRVGTLVCCGLNLCIGLGLLAGCSTVNYQGSEPSARTFSECPGVRDYYVGMNFNFSMDRPTEYRHVASADASGLFSDPVAAPQAAISSAPAAEGN